MQRDFREVERKRKTEEAELRKEKWQSLTPEQQLKELDNRFGKDQGATRQRARIKKQIK